MDSTTATQTASDALTTVAQPDLNFFQFLAKFMSEGGVFMWVILGIWAVGLAVSL